MFDIGGLDLSRHRRDVTPGATTPGGHQPRARCGPRLPRRPASENVSSVSSTASVPRRPTSPSRTFRRARRRSTSSPVTAPDGPAAATAVTLYDVIYQPGSATNAVQVDVPAAVPELRPDRRLHLHHRLPLSLETGGYNAFTFSVDPTSVACAELRGVLQNAGHLRRSRPRRLHDGPQGDFSVEF